MSIIKKMQEQEKLNKKYAKLDPYFEIKESLEKIDLDKTVSINYYGHSDYITIRHSRGSLYLSLKEADAIRKWLNKLF